MPSVAHKRLNSVKVSADNTAASTSVGRQDVNADTLAASLNTTSFDAIRNSLSTLRSSIALSGYDERLDASDKRIRFAKDFLARDGLLHLRRAWHQAESSEQGSIVASAMHCLAGVIVLLSFHQPDHDLAEQIILDLLPTRFTERQTRQGSDWQRVIAHVSDTDAVNRPKVNNNGKNESRRGTSTDGDATLAALSVIHALTSFQGSKYARDIFDAMPWGMRSLSRLANMRRRVAQAGKKNERKQKVRGISVSTLSKPDIRTMWTLVLLSFLRSPTGVCTPIALRVLALTTAREHYAAILKGLAQDPAPIVIHLLMGLHDGLLSDEACMKLPRAKVVGLFNEWACKSLLELYEREGDEVLLANTDDLHSVSDVIHHFLLALCTHPGRGVCYMDEGWYGRPLHTEIFEDAVEQETQANDETSPANNTSILYNKILLGVLRSLSPTRSVKQAELALRILDATKELAGPYLSTISTLNPKATSVLWLSSSTFVGRALMLPLPSFASEGRWRAEPPPLRSSVDALLPACLTKSMFQRGIALPDKLAILATLSLLSRALNGLIAYKRICKDAAVALQAGKSSVMPGDSKRSDAAKVQHEDVITGRYAMDPKDSAQPWLEAWASIALIAKERLPDASQVLASIEALSEADTANSSRRSLSTLQEQGLRCVWLIQEALGNRSTINNSDVEQLFRYSLDARADADRFSRLASLHAMRAIRTIFEENEDYADVFAKYSGTGRSAFSRLLRLQATAGHELLHEPARALLDTTMQSSVMFEHDPSEWQVWQYALQHPSESLIEFIDECSQRCFKTVYRYIEAARSKSQSVSDRFAGLVASPLLFTIIEQFHIRMQKGLIKDSDLQNDIVVFLGRLIPALSVQGSPSKALRDLVKDCQSALDQSMMGDAQAPSEHLTTAQHFLEGLEGTKARRTSNGKQIRNVRAYAPSHWLDPFAFALEVLTASEISSQVSWSEAQAIDAKLIVKAISARLLREPACASFLLQVTLQCLNKGAYDGDFLSHSLLERAYLQEFLETESATTFMVEVVTQGPFQTEGDRSLIEPLIDSIIEQLQGEGQKAYVWSLAHRLVPFMNEQQQNSLLEHAKAAPTLNDSVIELIGSLTIDVSHADLEQLLAKLKGQPSRGAFVTLCNTIERSKRSMSENVGEEEVLVKFLVTNSALSMHADSAIARLLSMDVGIKAFVDEISIGTQVKGLFARLPRSLIKLSETERSESIQSALVEACMPALFTSSNSLHSVSACKILSRLARDDDTDELWSQLFASIPHEPGVAFSTDALLVAAKVQAGSTRGDEFGKLMVQQSLLWLVRRFAEDEEDSNTTIQAIEALTKLIIRKPSLLMRLAHLAEPVLTAGIKRRLKSLAHVRFLRSLLIATTLKPEARQKFLLDMLGNREALSDGQIQREVISLTSECLRSEPRNATSLLLKELAQYYTGSLRLADRQILEIVSIFERKGNAHSNFLSLWQQASGTGIRSGTLNSAALLSLDVNRVLETCLHFPRARSYGDLCRDGYDVDLIDQQKITEQVYDPLLVLSALGQFLSQEKVVTGFEIIDLLRTNALGCAVCCLSSRCALVRSAALALICKTYAFVQAATFHEKAQLLVIFETLRNSAGIQLDGQHCTLAVPLPLTATLFIAHALRAQAQPSLYLYPLISRFMLQRATPLDKSDVPMLYAFLYASTQQSQTHRQQRIFIIRFMTSCLLYGGRTEWRTMKRRHVWHSLTAMYTTVLMRDTDVGEQSLCRVIEEFWASAMLREHAAMDVVSRLGFLQYLQQTLIVREQSDESGTHLTSCLLRCLTNLLHTCDLVKLEKATGGTIYDSLNALVQDLETKQMASVSLEQLVRCSEALVKLSYHLNDGEMTNGAREFVSRWRALIEQQFSASPQNLQEEKESHVAVIQRHLLQTKHLS